MELSFTQYCIFILMITQGVSSDEIRLDQSPAEVKKPGESVKISCKISGFDMTKNYMHWIRQKPGQGLEWIGRMDTGSNDRTYAESMKNQFIMTEHVQASTQYLEAKSLRAEDTALYYCAREGPSGWAYFDYWGKGTQVTVTSEQPEPSKMFPLIQCNQTSDDFTIGCLARGLTGPNPSFKWTDSRGHELSNFVQYPGVLSGGSYTAVSHLKITTNDWNQGISFTCQAENANQSAAVKKPADPSVLIYTSDLHQNNITLVCEVSSPSVSIRWKVNDDKPQIDGNQTATIQKSDGGKAVHSYLTVSSAVYETSTFTCTAYRGDKMVAKPFTTSKSKPSCPPISCDD